jgi:hypothetical protein
MERVRLVPAAEVSSELKEPPSPWLIGIAFCLLKYGGDRGVMCGRADCPQSAVAWDKT